MRMVTPAKRWTLPDVHRLPDDGNRYELVHGELFVTPPPTDDHETILARLARILEPYVAEQKLGLVYRPRAVLRFNGSEVEPDLMVRQPSPHKNTPWELTPRPSLIVEVLSGSTRQRDRIQKRELYEEAEVPEYWMIDPEYREVTVVSSKAEAVVVRDKLVWKPDGAGLPLTIVLSTLFD